MFRLLSRPKVSLDIRVPANPVYPGGTISVQVTLEPRESVRIRRGVLVLVCREKYYTYVAGESDPTRWHEPIRLPTTFLHDTAVERGIPVRQTVHFSLPSSALSSAKGKVVEVEWKLEASLDIPQMWDVHTDKEFVVLPCTGSGLSWPLFKESKNEQFTLSLSLCSEDVRAGGAVQGTLRAQAWKDITVDRVWAELRREEKAGESDRRETVDKQICLKEKMRLLVGEVSEWPFLLKVPEDALASFTGSKSSARWRVKGIVQQSPFWRQELVTEAGLHVHPDRPNRDNLSVDQSDNG